MKQCKFCQAQLAEDSSICPSCGRDNDQPQQEPAAEQAEETVQETVETQEAAAESQPEQPQEETAEMQPQQPAQEEATEENPEELAAPIKEGVRCPGKIALAVAGIVVLLAVLIALVVSGTKQPEQEQDPAATTAVTEQTTPPTIPADGNPDDVTCKGSYTAADEAVLADRDTVVATMGENALTNSQLQVYYWMEVQGFLSNYGGYAAYFGLNPAQSMDTQLCPQAEGLTWQQYFLQSALNNWQQMQAMTLAAQEAKIPMDEQSKTYLENLDKTLEEIAASYSVDVEELLLKNFGPGADREDYRHFQELYHSGYPYFNEQVSKLKPTDKELEAFFAEHEQQYAEGGMTKEDDFVDVRHILVMAEGGTTDEQGKTTYTDEEWAACEKKAQEVLDTWLAGDKTEESFAKLATEKTQDPGSQGTGGLYERVYEGQMVQAFNDWCFDESRKAGDYGLVKTEYGYHVMYFVDRYPQWSYVAEQDWIQTQTRQMIDDLVQEHPIQVSYEKIRLGNVEMGQ